MAKLLPGHVNDLNSSSLILNPSWSFFSQRSDHTVDEMDVVKGAFMPTNGELSSDPAEPSKSSSK